MAVLDASGAFSKIFDMADPELVPFYAAIAGGTSTTARWKVLYDAPISPGFPGERGTITAQGQNFTYDVDGKPTSGEVTALNFSLGETGVIDTSVNFTSDVTLSIAGMFGGGSLQLQSQVFWAALLSGDDVILAPQQKNVGITGDFYLVAVDILSQPAFSGGNDRISVAFSYDPDAPSPGRATTNGEGPYSGLVGDAFAMFGFTVKNILFEAVLFGGADVITMSGYAGLDAIGDCFSVQGYGYLVGGNDRIVNDTHGGLVPAATVLTELSGDAHEMFAEAVVRGGRDTITGSDFAFYSDIISGDVNTMLGGTLEGGRDTITARGGQDRIAGDVMTLAGGRMTGGNDHIFGGEDSDIMSGDVFEASGDFHLTGGNDQLFGENGNDVMAGDLLQGDGIGSTATFDCGNDFLSGGDGNDILYGDALMPLTFLASFVAGDDQLDGGLGDDYIDGQDGEDTALFNSLDLRVTVDLQKGTAIGQGRDTLRGIENVVGSSRGDSISGDAGDNVIDGGAGNDDLNGRAGDDRIAGGGGKDILFGARGADVLIGGGGGDIFRFTQTPDGAAVVDRILDFADGSDKLDLSDFGFTRFATVRALASDGGAGLRIELPGEEIVRIDHFMLADFDRSDVIL